MRRWDIQSQQNDLLCMVCVYWQRTACLCSDMHCLWNMLGVSWPVLLFAWSSTIGSSLPTASRAPRETHWWPRRAAWCQNLNTSLWLVKTRSVKKQIQGCHRSNYLIFFFFMLLIVIKQEWSFKSIPSICTFYQMSQTHSSCVLQPALYIPA